MEWLEVIHRIQDRFAPIECKHMSASYPFFPCSLPAFASDLERCKEVGATGKFLDVGCGPGVTLAVAECFGFEAWGIEIDKKMASFGGLKVWNENALDFKAYNSFDIVYFYRPFIDKKKQLKLETKIRKEMKCGAFLIAYLPISEDTLGFVQQDTNIWRKVGL